MEGSTMNDECDRPLVTRYGVFLFCVWNICMALTWMYDL